MAGTYRQKTVIAICSSKSFERLDLSRDTGASVKYLEDVKVPAHICFVSWTFPESEFCR